MKPLFLFIFFIPAFAWAQDDSKYLAGAVPTENGKVVFSKEIVTTPLRQDEAFDIMLNWAKTFFEGGNSRIVYINREQGDIAVAGKENLVFQSTTLSLDQAQMDYRATIRCNETRCYIKVFGIRYLYNVAYKREPEKYSAEEWITDKYGLNKNKTKLNRGNAKFRRKTVDFIDNMFAEVEKIPFLKPQQVAAQSEPIGTETDEPKETPVLTSKEGYLPVTPDKIPATLLRMLPESRMELSASGETETEAAWKGTGKMFGKTIATIAIDNNSSTYKAIGETTPYTLSFFHEGENAPWLIINCHKQGETNESGQATLIGEILNVWIK